MTTGKTPIELWTGYGDGRMATGLQQAVDHFNQINTEYDLHHVLVAWGDIHTKAIAATAAKTPPDVYRGWSYLLASDAPIGALTALDSYIKTEKNFNLDDFWPPSLYQMQYKGGVYGIGCSTTTQLLYFNKDLMKERGLDTTNLPTDLAGWELAGSQLMATTNGTIERVGFMPFIPSGTGYGLFDWGAIYGGTFYDDATQKIILNQPANLEALTWFKSYADKYGPTNIQAFNSSFGGGGYGRETPQGALYTGRIAIWPRAIWGYNDMKEFGPKVDFGVVPLPSPKGVKGKPGSLDTNMYLVPNGAKNPAGGFAVANYMSGDLYETLHFEGVNDSDTPSRKSLATNPEVVKAAPWISLTYDILPNALPLPNMPATIYYQNQISAGVQQVLFKGADPKQVLVDVTTNVQAELDKALKR